VKEVLKEKENSVQTLHVKDVPKENSVQTLHVKDVPKEKETSVQTLHVKDVPKEKETPVQALHVKEVPKEIKADIRDDKLAQTQKEIKATPLFKAQATVEYTSTEQIVQAKVSTTVKVEHKTSKDKADETLKLLLRGEKPSINNTLTADFSVASARVVAPTATTEVSKSIEQLLHGDSKSAENTASKLDGLTTHKADSFEVKLNEAKQMIKYISADVKTAIEDYKSPFTRIKVQLNPQKLGEVDLTIVQRGKNLHVTLSSNNAAINTLALNVNELKAQLSNSGINNATLNFNNSSQDSNQNASQQQNRQNERQAKEEYSYLDKEEANEEVLSSLEIIVPQYG
jgi:flagellar hook-length control protein FliK